MPYRDWSIVAVAAEIAPPVRGRQPSPRPGCLGDRHTEKTSQTMPAALPFRAPSKDRFLHTPNAGRRAAAHRRIPPVLRRSIWPRPDGKAGQGSACHDLDGPQRQPARPGAFHWQAFPRLPGAGLAFREGRIVSRPRVAFPVRSRGVYSIVAAARQRSFAFSLNFPQGDRRRGSLCNWPSIAPATLTGTTTKLPRIANHDTEELHSLPTFC